MAAVVLAGLHLDRSDERGPEAARSATPEPSTPQPCADRTVRCHLLSTGVWAVVYTSPERDASNATLAPTPEERDGLVLWDPGGPGLRPLDAGTVRAILPSWLRGRTVATFVEPWVVHKVGPECLKSVENVSAGGELSESQTKSWPDEFSSSCDVDLYRLDRAEYEESFRELGDKEGEISGVYAQSFGAVRGTSVMSELERTGGWMVMDAPAPPPGTPATTLMVERSTAVEEGLQRIMGCHKSDALPDCEKELHQTLRDMGDGDTPVGLAGGTEEYERMTALFSLSHDLESNAEPLREILTNWPKLTEADQEIIGKASYSYTRRYGDGQVLPEFVGYLANVCTAYEGWGAGAGSQERNPLGAALSRIHYPCAVMPGSKDSRWATPDAGESPRLLLISNSMDPITPPRAAESWGDKYPDADLLEYEYSGHVKAPEELDEEISAWIAGATE
ncbi:alpha/beta hydrolase [Streptomyces sp. M92]|uniref:alpha/beta hydrolase n=1 Tax=Streptomyces sp. M92 TaxID=2944250 RepID=UPI00234B49F9|nr:alpha/beta hydrolase [Streptomyces sp. M92]WCN00990.1 alpha/beta hydrolase [Streptomyces sp. M92]